MPDPELERLEASASTIVRRAYELGWSDALKQVVVELNARNPGSERLELAPFAESPALPVAEVPPPPEAAVPPEPLPEPEPEPEFKPLKKPAKPWWARLGR
nr:hypothetical protein [uncultured Rhodopila sp.]